jgi:hypothetical protein
LITDSLTTFTTNFSINASVPLTPTNFFFDDVEGGNLGWTPGGTPNTWAITTAQSHTPTHSWTDSPSGDYSDNSNNYITLALDLTGKKQIQVSGWFKYALESGFDYAYMEYSLDGGTDWTNLATFNGLQTDWQLVIADAPALDNQANVLIRIRLQSDGGVVEDGIYMDDFAVSYVPFECTYSPVPDAPTLVSPANDSWVESRVTFEWQPAASGLPAEGYIFYLDETPVVTFTDQITTTTLSVPAWAHTWFVKATNTSGASLPSDTWNLNVFGRIFLPITRK